MRRTRGEPEGLRADFGERGPADSLGGEGLRDSGGESPGDG